MVRDRFDLVIAGVGGQGNLLLSRIIGETALRSNIDLQISETFGAAQRGAAVVSHVRLGKSYSPVVPFGMAQALLALEPAEALRQSRFLAPDGLALVNIKPIMSVEVLSGRATYPSLEVIRNLLSKLTSDLHMFDAQGLAVEAGDPRTVNLVMLGALDACSVLPFRTENLRNSISSLVPSNMIEVNLKAFDLGRVALLRLVKLEPSDSALLS
ncbi:hypothetical protein A3K71_05130 [archaeon RBG_16_50_20]|nr:MAG: hypothetical protein A3K71_05130 [archaeon RBG_16_50_20]